MTQLSHDRPRNGRAQKPRYSSLRDRLRLELELVTDWFRLVSARGLETLLKYGIRPGSEIIDLPPSQFRDLPERREPPARRSSGATPSSTWRFVRGRPRRHESAPSNGAETDA